MNDRFCAYMEDKIHKILSQKYDYYNKYYKPFQILNLTRILPYTKNEKLKESYDSYIAKYMEKERYAIEIIELEKSLPDICPTCLQPFNKDKCK